jgi:sugar/nucleoside kinase (ribokinase family)
MSRVVITGHVCVDLRPTADRLEIHPGHLSEVGPLHITVGGSVANTGVVLARLGHDVEVSARVGDDDLGAIATRWLSGVPGLEARMTATTAASTSYSIVVEPGDQDRSFWHHVGANALYDGTEPDLDGVALLHLGYPSLLPSLTRDGGANLRRMLERARAAGATTSLDLAVIDPGAESAAIDWRSLFADILPLVDVITPSADDLRTALGIKDATTADFTDLLITWGAAVAAVSDGAAGLHIRISNAQRLARSGTALAPLADGWADQSLQVAARMLQRKITTNGAGDAATAGFLSGLLRGLSPAECAQLSTASAAAVIQGTPLPSPAHAPQEVSRTA